MQNSFMLISNKYKIHNFSYNNILCIQCVYVLLRLPTLAIFLHQQSSSLARVAHISFKNDLLKLFININAINIVYIFALF